MEYEKNTADWPYDGFIGQYQTDSWQYAQHGGEYGQPRGGEENAAPGGKGPEPAAPGPATGIGHPLAAQATSPPGRDAEKSALRFSAG